MSAREPSPLARISRHYVAVLLAALTFLIAPAAITRHVDRTGEILIAGDEAATAKSCGKAPREMSAEDDKQIQRCKPPRRRIVMLT